MSFEATFLFSWCHQCHLINWHCIFFPCWTSHFKYIRFQKKELRVDVKKLSLNHVCAEYYKLPEPLKATRLRQTSSHTNHPSLFHDVSHKVADQYRQTSSSHHSCHTSVKAPVWITHQAKAIKIWHPPSQSHRVGISFMMGSWHLKSEGQLTLGFVPPNPWLIAL